MIIPLQLLFNASNVSLDAQVIRKTLNSVGYVAQYGSNMSSYLIALSSIGFVATVIYNMYTLLDDVTPAVPEEELHRQAID